MMFFDVVLVLSCNFSIKVETFHVALVLVTIENGMVMSLLFCRPQHEGRREVRITYLMEKK